MERWIPEMETTTWEFLDLTYLPPYDLDFIKEISKRAHKSSLDREHASAYWGRGGLSRYGGTLTSQSFWTACGGPLAVRLGPHMRGKIWDERPTVPRALWQLIIELWHLRYPERELPSPDALRRRVCQGFVL